MIKPYLKEILDRCFDKGVHLGKWSDRGRGRFAVEVPKHNGQGDFSTNVAMIVAGMEGKKPRDVAADLVEIFQDGDGLCDRVEIAGPGFINFFVTPAAWQKMVPEVLRQGKKYGHSIFGKGKKALVEFVSANPTGPLSVGHGRQAALGDAIARLLSATGYDVTREYYYNNAGRQMRVLGQSTRARYMELLDINSDFPEDGYQGEYISDIAKKLVAEKGDSLQETDDLAPFTAMAEQEIFVDINATLQRMGIVFDSYYNEQSLYDRGLVDDVVEKLKEKGLVYEKDGAVWFKTTDMGLDQDRVIIKSTGEATYRLPDIAYHREKFRRGFDIMINVFGSDHIATVPDVLAGVRALGLDDSMVTVVIHQFVTLVKGGRQVKMSTRKATFVTVDQLLEEVGTDAVRFFFLMRKADSQLEFDLELAASQSQENPVYYVQYAHARLCSIARLAEEKGYSLPAADSQCVERLTQPEEMELLQQLAGFPELIENAAIDLAPHRLVFFLVDLAGKFHSYYNKHKILGDDHELAAARLLLAEALRQVFYNGLSIVGIGAPEKM